MNVVVGSRVSVITGWWSPAKLSTKKIIPETTGGLNQSSVTVASTLPPLLEGVEMAPPYTDRGEGGINTANAGGDNIRRRGLMREVGRFIIFFSCVLFA